MKKEEEKLLSKERVNVIMEYITQILSDDTKLSASMDFSSAKIDGNNMCTLDIYVPYNNFERHISLEITNDHSNVIKKEFLDRVISDIFPSDTLGATKFYKIRGSESFDGIYIVNNKGSKIKVNMHRIDNNIMDEYNNKYNEYNEFLEANKNKHKM